ncbi:MAG: hypothetical protein H0Z37_03200 [Firmicutes bacterium]|nr:hypothetical protein [Bacillota bacterium]
MARQGAWRIAAAYAGTVVGAGFASGQETLQFFTAFGPAGSAGLILAVLLFSGFGVRVLWLGRKLNAGSHRPLVHWAFGPRVAPIVDWVLTLFLLATAAAMASGAAATMLEQYGWPRWLGAALMTALSAATVLTGLRGVIRAIAFVAPLLIGSVLAISAYSLSDGPGIAAALAWEGRPQLAPVEPWWLAGALYVAYNMVLAVPVLGPLGAEARDRAALAWGGALGGIGLGLGAGAIHLAVAAHMPEASRFDIPMLYAARGLPPWVPLAYSALLLAEVYTTAVAVLFGFAARLGEESGPRFRAAVIGGGAAAFVGGLFPFAEVVGTVYPLMGLVGGLMLLSFLRPWR